MNKKYFIANWKMNNTLEASTKYIEELGLVAGGLALDRVKFVICPSFPYFYLFDEVASSGIELGAQDIAGFSAGAYTGEISAQMLQDFGVKYCIIGHSERRVIMQEGSEQLANKLSQVGDKIMPIYCIGESLNERKDGIYLEKLAQQLELIKNYDKPILVAYEPIWAIGTGISANVSDINEVFAFIKNYLSGKEFGIIYGGSVNVSNVDELVAINDLSGFLVGNASLEMVNSLIIYNRLAGVKV